MKLHEQFPQMTVASSCISERQVWQYGKLRSVIKDREAANLSMRKAVGCFGGQVIEHSLLR